MDGDVLMRGMVTRVDIMIAVLILIVGGAWYVISVTGGAGEHVAVLEIDGSEVQRFDLGQPGLFSVDIDGGREIGIEIEASRIRMVDTDICPHKICVHTNWIKRPGQAIVCLPNRVVIRIIGDGRSNNVDAITGQ